ncbi:MAG TPA: transposase, partial [Planctomycetota bacterium]|nr:transposase [Planctomycetota bacterium]
MAASLSRFKSLAESSGMDDSPPTATPPYWHGRGYLPHYESSSHTQVVTFRLADSLPAATVAKLAANSKRMATDSVYRLKIETLMDAGYGACWLKRPEIARVVQQCLHKDHHQQYELLAYVVMPNHLHVILDVTAPYKLSRIIQAWKTFSALA